MTSLKIAIIIQNSPPGAFDANLDKTLHFTKLAAENNARIALFPEMNLTGYLTGSKILKIARSANDKNLTRITKQCSKYNITVMSGLAEQSGSGRIYAAHLVFNPDGSIGKYRKIHTAPFEKEYYSSGDKIEVFEIDGFRFGIQLCYDAHFPELACAMALKGADAVLIPHASPRGTCEEKYNSWLRHLTARAFDNGMYIAACNQTGDHTKGLSFPGIGLFIGPDGHVIESRTDGKESIFFITIEKNVLERIRSHKMRYFLPNRRNDLFKLQ